MPENCIFSDPPKNNSEIKNVVSQSDLTRDARIQLKQQKITASLSAISKALKSLIKDRRDVQHLPVIECLSDPIKRNMLKEVVEYFAKKEKYALFDNYEEKVLTFLTLMYDKSAPYSSINCYRSCSNNTNV